MSKKRQSNIELLRIIAILFIISFHYVYKSGYVLTDLNITSLTIKSFWFLGELGVNLFVLITGYFLITGKFSFKKLIKLIVEVNFYYIFTLILTNLYQNNFAFENLKIFSGLKNAFLSFFSVTFNQYWFITSYILIYILFPYINKFLKTLSKDEHKKILIILIIIWSIIPTIFGIFNNNPESFLYFNRFIWMIILYMLGAYIRLYSINFFKNKSKKKALVLSILSFITMILGIIVIYKFKDIFLKIGTKEPAYFWRPNTVPMLILSVSMFELFLNLKIKNNKVMNDLASTTLGIYMLHDGPLASTLWKNIFKSLNCLNSKFAILYIVFHTLIIFAVGVIVDLIRQLVEKITVDKILDSKIYKTIENKIKMLLKKIYNVI